MLIPLPSENCESLNMKLEVKYLLPASFFKFLIHQLSESLKMRKIFTHVIGMQKNPQNQGANFLNFYGLS